MRQEQDPEPEMIRTDPRRLQAHCADRPVCPGLCSLLVDRGSGRGEAVTKLRAAKNETVVFVIIILVPTKKSARLLTDS